MGTGRYQLPPGTELQQAVDSAGTEHQAVCTTGHHQAVGIRNYWAPLPSTRHCWAPAGSEHQQHQASLPGIRPATPGNRYQWAMVSSVYWRPLAVSRTGRHWAPEAVGNGRQQASAGSRHQRAPSGTTKHLAALGTTKHHCTTRGIIDQMGSYIT